MKLRHLDIFYAVMTCGSLTRAAEVLHRGLGSKITQYSDKLLK